MYNFQELMGDISQEWISSDNFGNFHNHLEQNFNIHSYSDENYPDNHALSNWLLMTVKYLNVNTYRYYCSSGELDIVLNKLL